MKFKLSPEEVQDMLSCFKPVFPGINGLGIMFETTPQFAREVLPFPLEPTEVPVVNICIQTGDTYDGMTAYLSCRYGDMEGNYGLGFTMDTDFACIYGREVWGEPKKLAVTKLVREDNKLIGSVERMGEEIVRIEANILQAGDPNMLAQMDDFHFKYTLKADATGIDDAKLVHVHFDNIVRSLDICEITNLSLPKTKHDVYGNIPVKKILGGFYADFDAQGTGKYIADVDGEKLLPYAFAKHDDYRLLIKKWF